jgi:hypothetical protein
MPIPIVMRHEHVCTTKRSLANSSDNRIGIYRLSQSFGLLEEIKKKGLQSMCSLHMLADIIDEISECLASQRCQANPCF